MNSEKLKYWYPQLFSQLVDIKNMSGKKTVFFCCNSNILNTLNQNEKHNTNEYMFVYIFLPLFFDFKKFLYSLDSTLLSYTKYTLIYDKKKIVINCCHLNRIILFGFEYMLNSIYSNKIEKIQKFNYFIENCVLLKSLERLYYNSSHLMHSFNRPILIKNKYNCKTKQQRNENISDFLNTIHDKNIFFETDTSLMKMKKLTMLFYPSVNTNIVYDFNHIGQILHFNIFKLNQFSTQVEHITAIRKENVSSFNNSSYINMNFTG